MDLQPTPPNLVSDDGTVVFGLFETPFRGLDLDRARLACMGLRLPGLYNKLRLKRWQHFALVLPDLMVGVAVVDTGYLAVSWCSMVDRTDNGHREHHRQGPLLRRRVPKTLWDDHCFLHAKGYAVDVHNHLDAGRHVLKLDIQGAGNLPAVRGELELLHDLEAIQPIVVSLPVGPNRAMYSHKVPLPLQGWLQVGDERREVRADEATAIVDVHAAHYPRHTWWRWATGCGRDGGGRRIAFNLTHNVNLQEDRWTENGVWVDGRLHPLGPVRFTFDPQDIMAPWHLETTDGAAKLRFVPGGERCEDLNLGLVVSRFHQPWGRFEGQLRVAGETIQVDDLFGVCEDHDARW